MEQLSRKFICMINSKDGNLMKIYPMIYLNVAIVLMKNYVPIIVCVDTLFKMN